MLFDNIAIGTDIEEISRFKEMSEDSELVKRVFTKTEIEYSFSRTKFAQHLCARFCAKEAVIKALSQLGINNVTYSDIEVYNEDNGMPRVSVKSLDFIDAKISLSHSKTNAIACVILYKKEV